MVAVAGLWDLGWNTPIKEMDLWEYPLRDFDINKFYMTPVSGILNNFVIEKDSLDEIINLNNSLTVVFVDENAKIELKDFKHPENALYVFGKATYSPFINAKREHDLSVRIKTVSDKGMLWGHQALGIILYDRLKKNGNNSNR